jgi:phosphohistidine phosphatase
LRGALVPRHHACVKRLYLLRHAKSSWKDAALADHDRPLSGRGRRAATAIGRHMRAETIVPELVLCSSALRARETLARIEPALGRGAVKVERQLYGAGADALMARLRRVPGRVDSVLVIAHNPGLQEFALALAEPAPASLAAKLPTGALVTIELAIDGWRALEDGCGELVGFVRPRELEHG